MVQRNGLSVIHCAEKPVADIVFVHGLFGKPQDTWTYKSSAASNAYSSSDTEQTKFTSNSTEKRNHRLSKLSLRSLLHRSSKGNSTQFEHEQGSPFSDPGVHDFTRKATEGLFWPKDLLPEVLPDTRIYVWGYDVDIDHIFSSASQATVFQHSMNLLNDLADCRISDEERARPLIFVAHSLGGIIVKDMLNASRAEVTYLKDILPATHGIIFLGTPHRGSQIASLGKIAHDIAKLLWKSPNTSVLRDLEVNSQTLERIGRGFNQILTQMKLEIHSFREEKPIKGIMVVNLFSSTIENGREIVGSIDADHINMTKFSSPLDVGFIRISNTLARWFDDIQNKKKKLPDDGAESSYDYDHEQVKRWLEPVDFKSPLVALMDQPIFISNRAISRIPAVENWQRSYGRVLNITGDTGYGKTSYAAALAEQKLQESSQTNAFAGFAFCRGLTSSAIFRSLLWQFTQVGHTKHEQAQQVMQAFHRHSHSETDAGITSDGGGVVFREIYEKLLSDYDQVTLILDAVDQCRSQEHFIRHISRLASYLSRAQVKCRILLTSRIAIEWPEAEKSNISHQVIPITENEMIDDIIQYVSRSLQNLRPPVSESSQARILLKCSHVAGDGWPYAMHKMATEYLSEGRHIAAQRIEESVLDYRKDKFPEESIPTIECKRVLASALGDQGLYQEAEALQRQLLNTLRLKQSDSTLVHVIMSDLAHTLADSERWAEAKEVQLQLVDIWERGGPETVGQLRTGIKNLAITCSNLGELDEAERMLRQGLDRDIEAFGDNMDHESIVLDKINLGQILAQQEKWDEARVLQLSAVEASLRIFGLDSPITLNCMSNAAWALQQQGEYVEAKELQLEVVAGRTRMYGPDHPLTLKICGNLAATLGGLHEFDEARKYARRALGYYVAS